MKKFKLLFFALLVATTGFFSSCEDKTENDTSISLAGDAGYVSENVTIEAGSAFKVKWTATSSKDMKYVSITRDDAALTGWNMGELESSEKNTYIDEATLNAPASAGNYTYAIIVYDKDKVELGRKQIVITTVAATAVTSIDNISMGGSSSSNGSYLDAETGNVYKLAELTANVKGLIDIVFDDGTLKNTASALTSSTGTKFASTTLTTAQFDAATTDFLFSSLTASLDNVSISANAVVFFQTKGGKKGLIKVKSMASATGDLSIALKVQP